MRRFVRPLFAIYAALILVTIVVAYPHLVNGAGGTDWRTRPVRPQPHSPVHGPAFATTLGAATFQYRGGAARSGTSTETFATLRGTPAWTFQPLNVGIHDASKSSPAVDDTGVYVGADSSWIYALDLAGKLRWKLHVASAARGVHATAALDDTNLYIGAYNGTFYALRKRDGELAWALRLGDTVGSSAVIDGDSLYVSVETFSPPDGFVARIRRATGEVVWLSRWLGEQSHSSPTLDLADGLVLVGANNSTFRALRADTGDEAWRIETSGAVKDTATLVDGIAYFTSISGALYAVRARDGHVLWISTLPGRSRSSPTYAARAGILVLGTDDGSIVGVDARSGRIAWRNATEFHDMISSAVVLRDGIAWMPCAETKICAFDAATGRDREHLEVGASITSVPTVLHGSLYIALDLLGGLVRFDPEEPSRAM